MLKYFLFLLVLPLEASIQRSVVQVVRKKFFSPVSNESGFVVSGNLGESQCDGVEAFSFINCSGLLLKGNEVLVGGSCVHNIDTVCRDNYFVFDFDSRKKKAVKDASPIYVYPAIFKLGQNLYECIGTTKVSKNNSYAIFKLKQRVQDREVFEISQARVKKNDLSLIDGHGSIQKVSSINKRSRGIASLSLENTQKLAEGFLISEKSRSVLGKYESVRKSGCVKNTEVSFEKVSK